MLVCALLIAAAPRTGTVRIHLTDAHNRSIPNHDIWLSETNSTKPVRPFGVQWYIPSGPGSFHGTSNRSGDVAISRVPLCKPMMVVTKFGPRFDAFVGKDNPSGLKLDVMKFEGAVYAGKRAHIILANDREITGKVTDAAGKPLNGVKVLLSDTGFGHMGGYPGTTLDRQATDGSGVYRFTRLPSCAFLLLPDAPTHMAVESRPGKGPWDFLAIVGQEWTSASALLTRPITVCDFRIYPTARLTVMFKGTPSEFKGWTAWISRGSVTVAAREIDYDATSSTITCDALPGQITVVLTRDRGEKRIVAKKFVIKTGESLKVEISMAEVLKRKPSN